MTLESFLDLRLDQAEQKAGTEGGTPRTIEGAVTKRRKSDDCDRIDILVNNVGGTIWTKPYAEYEEVQMEAEIRRGG